MFRERPETKVKFLSEDELQRLYRAARRDPLAFAVLLIGARHGPRASEVQYIRLEDVDFSNKKIRIRRRKHSWTTVNDMQGDEINAIRAYMKVRLRKESATSLFTSNRGVGIGPRTVDRIMKKYSALAKLPKEKSHFHVLKHTCAVERYQADGNILNLQRWLGHVALDNTLIYAKLVDSKQAEINREIGKKLVRL